MQYSVNTIKCLFIVMGIFLNNPVFSASGIQLSTDKSSYVSGETVGVSFSSSNKLDKSAWIGLYKSSIPNESTGTFIEFQYLYKNTTNKTGTYQLKVPADSGNYEIRVISSERGKVLTTVPIKVKKINPTDISLSIITQKIKPGQPLDIKINSKFKMNKQAWVGIFSTDISTETATGFTSYNYITDKKGDTLRMIAPGKTGDYELRVYAAEYGALIKQQGFRVGELNLTGIKFSLNKKKYDPEENVIIKYTGHADLTDHAWLGLYETGIKNSDTRKYIDYQYLKPKTGGELIFKAPSNKGQYQIRLFYNDYGPELLSPATFTVTSSINEAYLKKNITEKGRVTLYGIYFDTDKSNIKPASLPLIKIIADLLKSNPGLKIRIEGHTDSQGDSAYNQALSDKRAKAVSAWLISNHGIPKSQLASKGYGESRPADDNNSAAGRAKNRRVELVKF
ncbi:hypothetical protein MNBD_GAMMA09-3873 [hydrothermal vent metagenome]|uniref:OmpA-like domain-containing protein n=1 Tax=hydrothermal vent metagenome TaxID=652676 RepID=A0A3B0X093_9ZZZZ